MSRRLLLRIALVPAAAILATSCSTVADPSVAASVLDVELTFADVDEALGDQATNAAAVRDLTSRFAIAEALRADLAVLGVETDPIELGDDPLADLDASIQTNVQIWQTVPVDQLATDDARTAYETGRAQIACLAHILTETEADADAALERIDAGESFGDVAAEVSLDTGSGANGGSLGCLPEQEISTAYVPGFAEAAEDVAVGEVAGPAESQFGWHLVTRTPFDELDQTQLLQLRLSEFEDQYEIVIDPKIGQWSGFGEVIPLG